MTLLIVTDIFGQTKALDKLADRLGEKCTDVDILDPYNSQYKEFETEEDAYKAFQKETGLEKYASFLEQKVKAYHPKGLFLLGFSAGASAIWAASSSLPPNVFKGLCFYSSQIRNYLNTIPNIPIELYFAKKELSYDVCTVTTHLSQTKNVTCIKTEHMHGFMNQCSTNFCNFAYNKYIERIRGCMGCYTAVFK